MDDRNRRKHRTHTGRTETHQGSSSSEISWWSPDSVLRRSLRRSVVAPPSGEIQRRDEGDFAADKRDVRCPLNRASAFSHPGRRKPVVASQVNDEISGQGSRLLNRSDHNLHQSTTLTNVEDGIEVLPFDNLPPDLEDCRRLLQGSQLHDRADSRRGLRETRTRRAFVAAEGVPQGEAANLVDGSWAASLPPDLQQSLRLFSSRGHSELSKTRDPIGGRLSDEKMPPQRKVNTNAGPDTSRGGRYSDMFTRHDSSHERECTTLYSSEIKPHSRETWSTLEPVQTLYAILNDDSSKEAAPAKNRAISIRPDHIDLPNGYSRVFGYCDLVANHSVACSRVAIVGLPRTGKTSCLDDYVKHLQTMAQTTSTLRVNCSEQMTVLTKPGEPAAIQPFSSAPDVCRILCVYASLLSRNGVVAIDGLNNEFDARSIIDQYQQSLSDRCYGIITTERLSIAKAFAEDASLVFKFDTADRIVSSHHSVSASFPDEEWLYLPTVVVHAKRFLDTIPSQSFDLKGRLSKLNESAAWLNDRGTREAMIAAKACILQGTWPDFQHDWEIAAAFTVTMVCVEHSWLAVLEKAEQACPAAIVLLGVLAILGKTSVDVLLWSKVSKYIRGSHVLAVLQDYGILVNVATGMTEYGTLHLCHAAVRLAIKVWLVGNDALKEALAIQEMISALER